MILASNFLFFETTQFTFIDIIKDYRCFRAVFIIHIDRQKFVNILILHFMDKFAFKNSVC